MADGDAAYAQQNNVSTPSSSANDKIYEPKHQKKIIRVLTVLAYVFFVSLAAIMLSAYYLFVWEPVVPKRDRPTQDRLVQKGHATGPRAEGLVQEDLIIAQHAERLKGVPLTLPRAEYLEDGEPPTVLTESLIQGETYSPLHAERLVQGVTYTQPLRPSEHLNGGLHISSGEDLVQRETYSPLHAEKLVHGVTYSPLHVEKLVQGVPNTPPFRPPELLEDGLHISSREDLVQAENSTPRHEKLLISPQVQTRELHSANVVQMREKHLVSVMDRLRGVPNPVTEHLKGEKFDYFTDRAMQVVTPEVDHRQPTGQGLE